MPPRLQYQAANLAGFRASEDPRFEAGIPDFMNGILNFSIHFNVVHKKLDWRNPKMKSLNSMPEYSLVECTDVVLIDFFSLFFQDMTDKFCEVVTSTADEFLAGNHDICDKTSC